MCRFIKKYNGKQSNNCHSTGEIIDIDIFDVEKDIDGIFLCSDGLTNMMSPEHIEKVINDKDLDIEEQINKLIMKSNTRGGNDNITIAYLVKSGD